MIKIIYDLLIAAILIVAFFMCILSFIWGFKTGKSISKGITPQVNLNPIKAHEMHVEKNKKKTQQELLEEGERNIMNYTGDPQ